jgi:predicted dehydrogenase
MKSSRRHFIELATAASVLPTGAWALEQDARPVSPNDKIRIATIGIGGQGSDDTKACLKAPGTELVAVADVYDGRLARAKEVWGEAVFTTRDYRELLARPDVDAVIISTPDHWHSRISVDALNAGKDVYCQKPMVQKVDEGYAVIEAQKKTGRIFQVGSQRVSSIAYWKAKELVASGAIGEINLVEAWWNRNSAIGAWQYSIPPDASPATVDWDRFLGHAPRRAFEPIRLFRWRNYQDYGTGVAGDLFIHLFSGIHLVTSSNGPNRVLATGGLRFWHDGRDVPDVMLGLYDYPKTASHPAFNLLLKVNFADGGGDHHSFRFVGSEGALTILGSTVTVSKRPRSKEPGYTIDTFTKATQAAFLKEYRAKYPEGEPEMSGAFDTTYAAPRGYSDQEHHFRNWIASIRSRRPPVEDAVYGMRAAGPALLSNRSYSEGKPLGWDPDAMKVKDGRSSG